jgi:dipeptidyl aminopeptidase/acylaminoacyl peptidase
MRSILLAVLILLSPLVLAPRKAVAQEKVAQDKAPAASTAKKHIVTVDDYFTLGAINELAISTDGKLVAYTEARWQESTNDRKNEIWITSAENPSPKRLTFDRLGYDTLRFAPDGKQLFYVASHKRDNAGAPYDGSRQVWRISVEGGDATPMTRLTGGVGLFELAADGKSLYYTTSGSADEEEWADLRSQFGGLQYATLPTTKTAVWQVDLTNWRTSKVLDFSGHIDELDVTRDGKRIAMITGRNGEVITMEGSSTVTIFDVASGKTFDLLDETFRKSLASPYGRIQQPKWSADGKALAFMNAYDAFPNEIFVATAISEKSSKIVNLPTIGDMNPSGSVSGGKSLSWKGESNDLAFLGDDHARVRIYLAEKANSDSPQVKSLTPGDVQFDFFAFDAKGTRAATIYSTPERMHNVYLFEGGKLSPLTDLHAHTKDWALPKISIFKWKGAKGDLVEGVLELPPDYQPGKPLPLIVNIHGGPTYSWPCGMIYGFTGSVMFASQGYAYLSPNYRGSSGYGDKFLTDLIGHQNEIDVEDILTGVDELVKQGIADKDRLAVAGWSNGGYLTNCCITKTDRFKAAASGAGIADQIMEWGANDEPAYQLALNEGAPWEKKESYVNASPVFDLGKIKTPTLFHVGEFDVRCPKAHGVMVHRALKYNNKIPTEMITYPGEGHGLSKYQHRKAKLTWELKWFEKYVRGQ